MELVKNIFFNTDKLVENSNVKISYTGDLFQKCCSFQKIDFETGKEDYL